MLDKLDKKAAVLWSVTVFSIGVLGPYLKQSLLCEKGKFIWFLSMSMSQCHVISKPFGQ